MENTAPKKKHIFLKIIAVIAAVLLLLFTVLRATHVIVYVGKKYRTCFDHGLHLDGLSYELNNKDVSEAVHMKRVSVLVSMCAHVTDYSFLTEMPHLTTVNLILRPEIDNDYYPKSMPSLKKSPNLIFVSISADVEDLDFISDNKEIKSLFVMPASSYIRDISGLRNKPNLEDLDLYNVDCSDMSPLLALKGLKSLTVIGTIIPDDIRDKLTQRGVRINNLSVEDYKKQQEEAKQKALQEEA